jgi:hypothetical protein
VTRNEALMLVRLLISAYPTQFRDAIFQGSLVEYMVQSGVSPAEMASRVKEWVRTEKFWPAISDLVYPPDRPAVPLLPPTPPIDTVEGLTILRRAYENR